ncbi:hypothetical protein QR680_012872 [Steinernema hermaphroditum]|uniref:RING-type domain-containing protein n=1 Tax=Steinernema hermaphroditum TaxID=289476 RepID=A0AA39I5M7_9BILA|nr:hypothetical protein QR680_012872 [Steinernema hermaphroditum]
MASPQPPSDTEALARIQQVLLTAPTSRPPNFANPLEKIEQLLTCPICLDRYKQPRLLPCQHTFCHPCLESCLDVSGRTLKCPECRAEHAIPYDGVRGFQTNLTLTGFLDIHLQASAENAAELEAYIQRYNLERCKVCDEKAQLEACAHCEKRACAECRTLHMETLRRDLARLLNQVKRLSSRVTDAAGNLAKGAETLRVNCEATKSEVREYFHRYIRELKRREENFLLEIDLFQQSEGRVVGALRDVLQLESDNMNQACEWLDQALAGSKKADDAQLVKFKNTFQEGLDYLRNFQPDAEDLFGKKIRFSPGDDASKLPTAIANFGELTICLPQFAGRYLPLEQSYLPRHFRYGLESDTMKGGSSSSSRRNNDFDDSRPSSRYSNRTNGEDENVSLRYRRRQQLEEEAWNRLRVGSGVESGRNSPSTPGHSPWSRSPIPSTPNPSCEETSKPATPPEALPTTSLPAKTSSKKKELSARKSKDLPVVAVEPPSPVPPAPAIASSSKQPLPAKAPSKPPLPRQQQQPSAEDAALNDRVESIRLAHEQRQKHGGAPPPSAEAPRATEKPTAPPVEKPAEEAPKTSPTPQRFRIVCKSAVATPVTASSISAPNPSTAAPVAPNPVPAPSMATEAEKGESEAAPVHPIPITYFPESSTSHRAAPPPRTDSLESASGDLPPPPLERRSRFRRRSSVAPDRELSRGPSINSAIDYLSKGSPKLVFGRKGQGFKSPELNWPRGLTPLSSGEMAVADSSNHRVSVFSTDGRLLRLFGKYGTNPGDFDSLAGVVYDKYRMQLIVSDRYNHRIQIFDSNGAFVREFGKHGPQNGNFNNPWGVAVDDCGQIFVCDKDNHRVQIFNQNGQYLGRIGSKGQGPSEFQNPLFVAIHRRTQQIYVSDSSNHRVSVFSHDRQPLFRFGVEGFHTGQLKFPRGIAVDSEGYIVVADSGNNRIQVFSPEGKFVHAFGSWGAAPGQMKGIEAVALVEGQIVVSDRENHRIQVF